MLIKGHFLNFWGRMPRMPSILLKLYYSMFNAKKTKFYAQKGKRRGNGTYFRFDSSQETAEPGVIEIFWADDVQIRRIPDISERKLIRLFSTV